MEKTEKKSTLAANPFEAGRMEAAERYGHLSKNAAQWRLISLVLLMCCAACVFAVIFMANKVTIVPYIVQVDEHGYYTETKPIKMSDIDDRIIKSTIARYIWSLKTVFLDREAQVSLIKFVENSTAALSTADTQYREYYSKNNPYNARVTKKTIQTTVKNVLPLSSESTWEAVWTEESYENGRKSSTKDYRGNFVIAVNPPKDMNEIFINPLGIYITYFHFDEISGGRVNND